jgi:uncharacterized membrane protein (UPF0182 family)
MLPFTPSGENKNNLVSWLAVRNSFEHYGEMIIFEFPKNTNVFGPYQVEVKINQIDKIASDMTLWSQAGTDVYKGNLLVIPIENSILYVEPIYIRASGTSSIPEVREIVVGYQDGDELIYGIGTNLEDALSELLKAGAARAGGGGGSGAGSGAGGGAGGGSGGGSAGGGSGTGGSSAGGAAGTGGAANAGSSGQGAAGGAGTGDASGALTDDERAAALAELNERYEELRNAIDTLGQLIEKLQ